MDIDGAGVHEDVAAPDAVEQLLARPDAAGLLHQGGQEAKLGRAELEKLANELMVDLNLEGQPGN